METTRLSKTKLLAWRQCPKRLWLQSHKPDVGEVTDDITRGFHIGYEVGDVARKLYPNGLLIESNDNLTRALTETQLAINSAPQKTIFEPAFQYQGLLVRVDILTLTASGFKIIEVKSSASVKPYYLDDCAIQLWVIKHNNVKLSTVEIAHINTNFTYKGDNSYRGLFKHVSIDEKLIPLVEEIPTWIEQATTTLRGAEPDIDTGNQCDSPYPCTFKTYCNRDKVQLTQPKYTVDIFPRMQHTKKETLVAAGFINALDVPTEQLNDIQRKVQRLSLTETSELLPEAAAEINALTWPRYYLDFETIALAIPRWANTQPYRTQVPFQWSCHIEHTPGNLSHDMFLDVSGDDPRRYCAESLVKTLGNTGPIFVYYQAFEKSRIREMANLFEDLSPALNNINRRIVDLLPIAQKYYYHPDMNGSWSIKKVLPTIAPDLSYSSLIVGHGGAAQEAYTEIVHEKTPQARKQELTEGLREYCKLDTLAMVKIAWFFCGFKS